MSGQKKPSSRSARRLWENDTLIGYLFLAPFLVAYVVLMVYPFLHGFWISLNEWNLLAVTFNPDAREFIWFDNYEHLAWGEGLGWSFVSLAWLRAPVMLAMVLTWVLFFRRRISRKAMLIATAVFLVLYLVLGWTAEPDGTWYDRRFWPVVGNTILFVALTVPGVTVVGLLLAVALNRETRAMSIFRTIFFLSQVLSVTVVTLIWQIIYSPSQGLIANILIPLGLEPPIWLTSDLLAMPAIVITTIWWSIGLAMVIFIAGLQEIPKDLYEAARIDGANAWHRLTKITLPNIKRTVTLVVVTQIVLHFQVFGQSHLMTNGGPNDQTQVLVRYIYQTAFRDSNLGQASAMAMFLFLIMATFSAFQIILNRDEGPAR